MSDPLALRAAQQAILASGSSLARPGGLCGPCVELLPVTGAAVSTLSGPINNETVCASDDVAFRIDELQFDLGEGPCWEAFASRRPVLIPDLRDGPPVTPWPVFSTAIRETPAAALFAFPLYVGGTGIGALDLYRRTAGPLDEEALHDARILADTVAIEVMRRILAAVAREEADLSQIPADPDPGSVLDPWQESPRSRREIHQATGMIMDQLDLTVGAAFARLRAHAFATDSSVADVAHEIVNRRLRFPERLAVTNPVTHDDAGGRGYGEAMNSQARETRLAQAFVTLADTLVAGYDLVELMHYLVDTTVELLDAADAGLLLEDGLGRLDVLASTSERTDLLEVLQVRSGRGPCWDCFNSGLPGSIPDLTLEAERWPEFTPLALQQGYRSVHAVPLRLRHQTIGALNMFRTETGELAEQDRLTAQALADVATIGVLQERAVRDGAGVDDRLQYALSSRVVIEQAKGVLAQHGALDMDQAFVMLRGYARRNHLPLTQVGQSVVDRDLRPAAVLAEFRSVRRQGGSDAG